MATPLFSAGSGTNPFLLTTWLARAYKVRMGGRSVIAGRIAEIDPTYIVLGSTRIEL